MACMSASVADLSEARIRLRLYVGLRQPFQDPVASMPVLNDTIFALATPAGKSALAVFRVSGPMAGAVLDRIAGGIPKPRVAALRRLRHPQSKEVLDEALVLWFPAPRSETGEDIAELQVHGGRAVIAALTRTLLEIDGVRLAEPGEFARRAFSNGKLDLTAVEGLADLIDAETEGQRRQAVRQSSGSLGALYESWRKDIIEAMALMEASIDFSDEADVAASACEGARQIIDERVLAPIRSHLDDGRRGEILRDGYRVVIAGPPNAGKSSLINALSRRDVAIVAPEAGTTRDVIEVALDLAGLPVIVSDTAGIRDTEGFVEQEGIRRTMARAADANLLVWLVDGTDPASLSAPLPPALAGLPTLRVVNKVDRLEAPDAAWALRVGADVLISAATGAGISDLVAQVTERARAETTTTSEAPVLTQARHRMHLQEALAALEAYLDGPPTALELRAEDLRQAAQAVGRITGRIDPEQVLDRLFSRFCIGK